LGASCLKIGGKLSGANCPGGEFSGYLLYDSTLEPIETCTAQAKNTQKTFESFWVLVPKRNVMFHKINILSSKVLPHFYVVGFGKAGFCKHCHVNRLDQLVELAPSSTDRYMCLKITVAKTRFTTLCLRNYLWGNRFFRCVMQLLFFSLEIAN